MKNKILIADDSQLIRSMLGKMLSEEGYDILTAEDGLAAIKKTFSSMPDLIIMDISMPGINGFLASRLLKNDPNTSNIPIIILTSKKNPINKFWGKEVGADSYIIKSSETTPIINEVKRLLKIKEKNDHKKNIKQEEISDTKILGKISNLLDNELIKSTLRKMELESILHNINEAIIVIDKNDIIKEINQYASKLFNIKEKDAGKTSIRDIFPEKEFISFENLSKPAPVMIAKEITYKSKNKRFSLMLDYSILRNFQSEIEYIVLFFRDITQQKEFERMKGEYFYNIVQEIRNPLTSAKEAINFLIEESDKSPKEIQKSVIKIIKEDVERLIRFTEKIINISELELSPSILNIEKINLNEIVKNAFKKNEKMAEIRNIKTEWKEEEKNIKIKGDKEKLIEVFSNIFSNAIKYNKHKGKIKVKIKKTHENGKNFAMTKIKDTGIGIDASEIELIFDKEKKVDARLRKKGGEFGLNLIIAKMVIELHNGKISLKSFPSKGTEIKILLPI